MLTASVYQEKRDGLVGLLKKTTTRLRALVQSHKEMDLPELDGRLSDMERTCTRVYEDQFRIALVSTFQGGKSTTFNALADGMEISPRGDGAIACSASVITAWNVENPAECGVEIAWRSKQELVQVAAELLQGELTDIDRARFAGMGNAAVGAELDLDNPVDMALFRRAVGAKLETYRDNQKGFRDEEFPVLVVACIISRYYGQQFVGEAQKAAYTPTTVGRLIRFPKDYRIKIGDFLRGKDAFDPEELLFAFIREVKCRIHGARGLRAIGTAVTDCPGLSASAYDTRIAMDVFAQSDAVWYLLDGKQIGQAALGDMSRAIEAAGGGIFATVNMKSDVNPTRKHIENQILPAQRKQLEDSGMNVDLQVYHALLSLLAVQGPQALAGTLDKGAAEVLVRLAQDRELGVTTAKDAWVGLVKECLYLLKVPAKGEFDALPEGLSDAGIDIVRRESCLDNTLELVKQYVIANKADSILRLNGTDPAIAALKAIERSLRAREVGADTDVVELRRKHAEMRARLGEFHKDAQDILEALENPVPDRRLAEDLIDRVVIPACKEAARPASERIDDVMGIWEAAWNLRPKWLGGDGGESQRKEITSIVGEEVAMAVEPRLVGWAKDVEKGENPIMKRELLPRVDLVRKRLQEKWDKQPGDLKENLPLPTGEHIDPTIAMAVVHASLAGAVNAENLKQLGIDLSVVGGIAIAAAALPLIGTVFVCVAAAVYLLFKRAFASRDPFIKELTAEIGGGIETRLRAGGENRGSVVDDLAERTTSAPRKAYLRLFQAALEEQRRELEKQQEQALADLARGECDRERIASECGRIRAMEVDPLLRELNAFRDSLTTLMAE